MKVKIIILSLTMGIVFSASANFKGDLKKFGNALDPGKGPHMTRVIKTSAYAGVGTAAIYKVLKRIERTISYNGLAEDSRLSANSGASVAQLINNYKEVSEIVKTDSNLPPEIAQDLMRTLDQHYSSLLARANFTTAQRALLQGRLQFPEAENLFHNLIRDGHEIATIAEAKISARAVALFQQNIQNLYDSRITRNAIGIKNYKEFPPINSLNSSFDGQIEYEVDSELNANTVGSTDTGDYSETTPSLSDIDLYGFLDENLD